jgi:lipid-A-disaccharide synthase
MSADSVLIIAAEASSSLYAQRLLELWRSNGREVKAFGIGSRQMEKLGFECIGRSEEMAVVGLQEVLKHLPHIRRVYHQLLELAEERRPKFALLLDYPDFNLRLAKDLKARGVKVIYYISPQVWAWRTGRVKTIRQVVDHMLVLFPFEETFYREHGVKVDFVGHPLLDELPQDEKLSESRSLRRQRFGLNDQDIVLGLMPGSRRSEIEHHLQAQLEAAAEMMKTHPRVRTVLMVAPTLDRTDFRAALSSFGFPVQIIKEEPLEMIDLADVILVASGTATLMVGLMKKPMVIMYRMNALSAWLAKKLVTKTKYFGLANLILNDRVVPELFQEQASPAGLAREASRFIDDARTRAETIERLGTLRDKLGAAGATRKVAQVLEAYFA